MPLHFAKNLICMGALLALTACAGHSGKGLQTASTPAKTLAPDVTVSSDQTGNSGVQIFSLDDPAPAVDTLIASVSDMPTGDNAAVTIYPLTGANTGMEATANSMAPVMPTPMPALSSMPPPNRDPNDDMTSQPPPLSLNNHGTPNRVYFADNSARVGKSAHRALQNAASLSGNVVSVEGHASARVATPDPVAGRIVNLKLSMQRTIAVSRQLVASGVAPTAIRMIAYGDAHPSPPVAGKSAEAASRRVEIYAND